MKGLLVRVGIDSTSGEWNGPVNSETNEFVYVPIPERHGALHSHLVRRYDEVEPALNAIGTSLPEHLQDEFMHLDPDFAELTYGDCHPRSLPIAELQQGDFIVFYAGLRSVAADQALVYALIGFYRIHEVVEVAVVERSRWHENAHTRRCDSTDDLIVRAVSGESGRLSRCIPVGEYRRGAYRVLPEILKEWGGLSVNDGYLQRSGRLPSFQDPVAFIRWFEKQDVQLIRENNL